MSRSQQKSQDENRHIRSPLKKTSQESVATRPLSQVPYLNGVFDDEEAINQPQVIYVRETDSDYIRRCKLGGSRDLLVYIDPASCKSKEPVAYARPLWWDAMCEDFPSPPNGENEQQQEKRSSKSEHEFSASSRVVHTAQSSSPDRRRSTTSRQSQLSKNGKKK
ncbi:unnamed protein product [Rotaria socialis]|uniref:Uncharacterized protein n=1 Tax=Rotaria socialis TaxID=392032 RepID=A0A818R6Z5_9BILA|nr:unnamed protein product [Rotaria socialis]CAF3649213.1 unnamed protein product [Rotaria socialis]CAF3713559.1 unnamed protein product [Rotaria socialis]CAF4465179.1 unnamed protein product [Rotaria socialis]CAF4513543.1 unnamed protein product [Rotaria socialis]